MISLKHISTLSTFNQTKFSADSTNSSYFLGSDQTQIFQGTPDVKYNDLCYIKCSNLQYTHGHLYGSTEVGEAHVSLTQEEYDALSEEEKNNGKIYLIKESTIPDLIDQLPLATTSAKGLMSAEDKMILLNNSWERDNSSKIGNLQICRIKPLTVSIPVCGFLILSGEYYDGLIGSAILRIACDYTNASNCNVSMKVVQQSVNGLFKNNVFASSDYGSEHSVVVSVNFGTYTYTGTLFAKFIGLGQLEMLI